MKKLLTMIEHATDFGSFRSRIHLFPFLLKIIMYIIPALILGHYTDVIVKKIKSRKTLGDNELYYIIYQSLINVVTLYVFILFLPDFASEFQRTISGGYFVVLYFGMQTNYIEMLKEYMHTNSFI